MSLFGMMRTSVSGMNAQAGRLSTVADNIANAGTIGYKRNTIQFSTQVLDANTGSYNSGSVETTTRTEVGRQGALRATTSATDLAISGAGFFVVEDPSGANFLTRAGSFIVDGTGNLVNAAGNALLGYDLSTTGGAPVANGFGGLTPINVGLVALQAEATDEAILLPNLPAGAPVVAPGSLPSDNVATSEFAGKTSLLLYDSLGNERLTDVYFAKTAANNWEATVYDNAGATAGGFPYASGPVAQLNVPFDPLTGLVVGGGSTGVNFNLPTGETVLLNMDGISQLGSGYEVLSAETNGNPPGSIERVEVGGDGTLFGIFQNGNAVPIYQLALAKVISPDNLRQLPGNNYSITIDSGNVLVGLAESTGFGSVEAGALEESNVDMATELTIMIESQRTYSANSKVFQTGSELMDVLINLQR